MMESPALIMKSRIAFLMLALGSQVVFAEPKVIEIKRRPPAKMPELVLDVENDGTTSIRGQRIASDNLAKHLAALKMGQPEEKSKWGGLIRGRRECPFAVIQNVMRDCGNAGFENISFGKASDEPPAKTPAENAPKP